jgi:hypothetical protein
MCQDFVSDDKIYLQVFSPFVDYFINNYLVLHSIFFLEVGWYASCMYPVWEKGFVDLRVS